MRVMILAAVAVVAACATPTPDFAGEGQPNPFPVERGSALPPPAPENAAQNAPPEGAGPGGIDFGRWRGADPAVYGPAFQAQLRARYANQATSAIRADLEGNGFACEESGRLDCRIEIMERECAIDWYVVVERARAEPVAGHDVMCLGAR